MRGDLTFNGIFTCQRDVSSQCIANTGFPYADGLLGQVRSSQLTNVHFVDQRLWMASGFFEDDWKVTPKLTLNLGLRYDFVTPTLEGKNQMANFDPDSGSLVFARSGGLRSRGLVDPNHTNFGPRIGFAYSPDQKTVIRGGYGVYYTLFERIGSEDQLGLNPPFLINKTPSAASTSTTPVMIAQNGFPSTFLDPSTINLNDLTSFHIRAVNPHDPHPTFSSGALEFSARSAATGLQRSTTWREIDAFGYAQRFQSAADLRKYGADAEGSKYRRDCPGRSLF